jgi:hypothetical protein
MGTDETTIKDTTMEDTTMGISKLPGEYEAVPGEFSEQPQRCIRCDQPRGLTRAIFRERLSSLTPTETRGLICDGCLNFSVACSRSRPEERLTVITPSTEALAYLFRNLLCGVEVLTESDRSRVLKPDERAAFRAILSSADQKTFFAILHRLEEEIVERHPEGRAMDKLLDAARFWRNETRDHVFDRATTEAFELITQVSDLGLLELQRAVTERTRLSLVTWPMALPPDK